MKAMLFRIVLLLACCYAHFASAKSIRSKYVNETLQQAKDTSARLCGRVTAVPSDVRTSTRKGLESFSGNNIILQVLRASNSFDDIPEALREKLNVAWLIGLAWPMILGIILAIVWWFCCWSTCGCCRRCRCCVRKRNNRLCKVVLVIPILCACGYVAAAAVAFHGDNLIVDGSDAMLCAAADLIDTVLSGTPSPYFVGLVPAVEVFGGLASLLTPATPFITGIVDLLNKTEDVSTSVYVVGQTLTQLSDAMSDPRTVYPATPTGTDDLMHKCVFCAEFGNTLQPVKDSLTNGVGNALATAREEVQKQLTGDNLNKLRGDLENSMAPMSEATDQIVKFFGPFVDPAQLDKYGSYYSGKSSPTYIVISILIADCVLLFLCGGCAFGLCICCEKDRKREEADRNPYRARNHRCACVTFWCNWQYAVFTLIIGGILWIVLFLVSSLCVTMEDIDKPMLVSIMPVLGLNQSSNDSDVFLDIVDRCLSPKSQALYSDSGRNLFDIVRIPSSDSDGSYQSLRESVLDTAIDPVKEVFDSISAAISTGSGLTLANAEGVVRLTQLLKDVTIDMMTLPDLDKMRSSPYDAMSYDSATSSGFYTSMACSKRPTAANTSVIDDFFRDLQRLGTAEPLTSCSDGNAAMRACNETNTPRGKACDAGKELLRLKMQLKQTAIYKCNVFQNPLNQSQECDVYNMVKGIDGVWGNTCLFPDRTMRVFQKNCSLDEFSDYISNYSQRIANVMGYMDDAVLSSASDINGGLRDLVTTFVIKPILDLIDGFNCSFMLPIFGGVVDGLCYQVWAGMRTIANVYVSCGFLSMIIAYFAYLLFRYTVDNYNIGMKEEADKARPIPPAII